MTENHRTSADTRPAAPVAAIHPIAQPFHGDMRTDPYAWMAERDSPALLAHLAAEDAYLRSVMASARVSPGTLLAEIRARTPAPGQPVPVPCGGYLYHTRVPAGRPRPVHCRRPASGEGEEVLLDENALAESVTMAGVTVLSVSPDHRHLLFGIDALGDGRSTLFVKDLATGALLPEAIPDAAAEVAWSDESTFFCLRLDRDNRPFQVLRHRLGTRSRDDRVMHAEEDPAFRLSLRRSESGRFLFLTAHGRSCSDAWWLPCAATHVGFARLVPRVPGVEVFPTHQGRHVYLLTNEDAPNSRLVRAPVAAAGSGPWETVLAHRPDVRLLHVQAFARHLAVHEREAGVPHLRVIDTATGDAHRIGFAEPFYALHPGDNRRYDSAVLRFGYDSVAMPPRVYDYDMDERIMHLRDATPVPGHDPSRYATVRLEVRAPDGTGIPLSLAYRRDWRSSGDNPLVLCAGGTDGHGAETGFSAARLSLLDRGVIVAVAHLAAGPMRGGGASADGWHRAGRRIHKPQAVRDLIASAEHLVALGLTGPARLGLLGQGDGGSLVAAAMNARPDLFAAVVADRPFVDPIGRLSDLARPGVAAEWEEWGNPCEPAEYAIMKSYAPYDTVRPVDYPHVLLVADDGEDGGDVVKLAAKLRAAATGRRPVLLHPRGGEDRLREQALVIAFLLDRLLPPSRPAAPT